MFAAHRFDTGELTLSYADGVANGPPLLLLHGLLARWQSLKPVMGALGSHWHVHVEHAGRFLKMLGTS